MIAFSKPDSEHAKSWICLIFSKCQLRQTLLNGKIYYCSPWTCMYIKYSVLKLEFYTTLLLIFIYCQFSLRFKFEQGAKFPAPAHRPADRATGNSSKKIRCPSSEPGRCYMKGFEWNWSILTRAENFKTRIKNSMTYLNWLWDTQLVYV